MKSAVILMSFSAWSRNDARFAMCMLLRLQGTHRCSLYSSCWKRLTGRIYRTILSRRMVCSLIRHSNSQSVEILRRGMSNSGMWVVRKTLLCVQSVNWWAHCWADIRCVIIACSSVVHMPATLLSLQTSTFILSTESCRSASGVCYQYRKNLSLPLWQAWHGASRQKHGTVLLGYAWDADQNLNRVVRPFSISLHPHWLNDEADTRVCCWDWAAHL